MAYQYNLKGNEEFEKKRKTYQTIGIIFTGTALCIFAYIAMEMIGSADHFHNVRDVISKGKYLIIAFIVSGGVGNYFLDKAKSMGASTSGRKIAQQSLEVLSNDYTVISNLEIDHAGKHAVFDTVVVGYNGVFVVSTCNRNSRISGSEYDKTWIQHKVGQKGTPYTSEFTNPLRKLHFLKSFLQEYLTDNGLGTYVNGFVVMTLADSFECDSYEMAKNQVDLKNKIEWNTKSNLQKEQVQRIIGLLTKED